jgi:hypothetical protein
VADINVERRSNDRWPWIIGILALVLIAAGVIFYFAQDNQQDYARTEQAAPEDTLYRQPGQPMQPGQPGMQPRPGDPMPPQQPGTEPSPGQP